MKNYLISAAIGDIAGCAYECRSHNIKLAISLGGDADTFYCRSHGFAYYKKTPDAPVYQAMKMLLDRMVKVSERFDEIVNSNKEV